MTKAITMLAVAAMSLWGAYALTLNDFAPVYKAKMEREGDNCVRVKFPSAEWGTGIKWESPKGVDFSSAKWLAVDVEN
ncbi:MAG: hypothetical protein IKL96_04640, partial [Kiritimatiellae bacterium]|nr:hypothetical protein [Kiritimatiellia bacterium]